MSQIAIEYTGVGDAQNSARALDNALKSLEGKLASDNHPEMLKRIFTQDTDGNFTVITPDAHYSGPRLAKLMICLSEYRFSLVRITESDSVAEQG